MNDRQKQTQQTNQYPPLAKKHLEAVVQQSDNPLEINNAIELLSKHDPNWVLTTPGNPEQ